jgi:hypothetical protein
MPVLVIELMRFHRLKSSKKSPPCKVDPSNDYHCHPTSSLAGGVQIVARCEVAMRKAHACISIGKYHRRQRQRAICPPPEFC